MAEIEKVYFLAGYIYAQAEQTVKELFPSLSDEQFRAEARYVQSEIIRGLSREQDD